MTAIPTASLRCPTCRGAVSISADAATCASCIATYPIRNGVMSFVRQEGGHPVEEKSDAVQVTLKNIFKQFPQFYRLLISVFGASVAGLSPKQFMRGRSDQVVLNLGSGSGERYGNAIHVDLFPFPGVDVVADITQLPFADASVDAIICLGTLEHVSNAHAVVAEMHRILKSGGAVYITTPFMQPYHSSPHDYQRWTVEGLKVLFGAFQDVHVGLRHGPTSALFLQLAYWLAGLFSFGSQRFFDLLLVIWMALLMPIAHLFDLPLSRMRISEKMASGYYVTARNL
jgi:SAM-dependent methyltransferase